MQEFDYYSDIKAAYPSKKDFTTYFVYNDGECVFKGTFDEYQLFRKDHNRNWSDYCSQSTLHKVAYKYALKLYTDEQKALHEEFERDLYRDFDVQSNPKREKCFALAWDRGHSAGYYDVYQNFADLVELIQ